MNVGSDRTLYIVVLSLPLRHLVVRSFFVGIRIDFPFPLIALRKQMERSGAGSEEIALIQAVIPIMGSLWARAFLVPCMRRPIRTKVLLIPVYFVF